MYKATQDFPDLRDGGYVYHKGDTYPRKGEADPKRAEALSNPTPQRGPLIEWADGPAPKTKKKAEG